MEMISPDFYKESNKDKDVNDLMIIKDNLEIEIENMEKICRHPEDSPFPFYDNETNLEVSRLYLGKIEELIKEKQGDN